MNVHELIAKLSRFDPELPVVMEQNNEPLGDYEVLDVEVVDADPGHPWHSTSPSHGGRPWKSPEVWNTYDGKQNRVVRLASEPPWQPTIDGELARPELPTAGYKFVDNLGGMYQKTSARSSIQIWAEPDGDWYFHIHRHHGRVWIAKGIRAVAGWIDDLADLVD